MPWHGRHMWFRPSFCDLSLLNALRGFSTAHLLLRLDLSVILLEGRDRVCRSGVWVVLRQIGPLVMSLCLARPRGTAHKHGLETESLAP